MKWAGYIADVIDVQAMKWAGYIADVMKAFLFVFLAMAAFDLGTLYGRYSGEMTFQEFFSEEHTDEVYWKNAHEPTEESLAQIEAYNNVTVDLNRGAWFAVLTLIFRAWENPEHHFLARLFRKLREVMKNVEQK